jgi:hypothetical protein
MPANTVHSEQIEDEKVVLQVGSLALRSSTGSGRREYSVRFIRAGRVRAQGNRPSNVIIPAEPIRDALAAGKFVGRAVFLDHSGWFDYPSLKNLVGVTVSAEWNEAEQSADGVIRFYESPAAGIATDVLDGMLADQAQGSAVPDVGLSLVFWPRWAPRDNEDDPRRLSEITHIESVDWVFEPGADGRVKAALHELSALAALSSLSAPQRHGEHRDFYKGGEDLNGGNPEGARPPTENERAGLRPAPIILGGNAMDPEGEQRTFELNSEEVTTTSQPAAAVAEQPAVPAVSGALPTHPTPAPDLTAWQQAMVKTAAQGMIASSGLPAASRDRLGGMPFGSPEEVSVAIEAERAYLAKLHEDQVVQIGGLAPRGGNIQGGLHPMDKIALAVDALISGTQPEKGVAPLTGIRELYMLLSGDYELTGRFQSDRVMLANADSSTMASLVANALNKRVTNMFMEYPRWWEPICTIEDFNTLQQVKWITLGGIGTMPTVAEGAAYTELTWDDKAETADFIKKGGYLGISLEAIDKDDTRRLQAAPRALAQAAWLALATSVSAIFTSNAGVGPDLADTYALFEAAHHANLGTTALSFAEYAVARAAMRAQTELNSGAVLGALTAPRYLLVPPELEITALQILATEQQPAQANYYENPFAEGDGHDARMNAARNRVIVIDLWTDANNWALVADPKLYPSIGLGFRYGRTPEIFSVASPTAGLMFTNDTMPIKARFFYAVGPIDYRGLYKENVA